MRSLAYLFVVVPPIHNALGDPLLTMPLRPIADYYFVPVELEATYSEACRRRAVTHIASPHIRG